MKKQNLLPLLAMVLLVAGSLHAQISSPVKAHIPFDFAAGNINLPAGEYQVEAVPNTKLLLIRGEGKQGMFVSSIAAQATSRSANSKLVFDRYGDRYFLSQIWVQGEDQGSELPMTKLEKELSASNGRPTLVAVLAYK